LGLLRRVCALARAGDDDFSIYNVTIVLLLLLVGCDAEQNHNM
jgi:hypothetical protein